MKNNLFYGLLLLLGLFLFSGCSKDDGEKDYVYTIGINDYQYSGSTLTGPMPYLESLKIPGNLTITSLSAEEADARAIAAFDTEMNKIDTEKLASYGRTYIQYVLYSVQASKNIREKEFDTKQE